MLKSGEVPDFDGCCKWFGGQTARIGEVATESLRDDRRWEARVEFGDKVRAYFYGERLAPSHLR